MAKKSSITLGRAAAWVVAAYSSIYFCMGMGWVADRNNDFKIAAADAAKPHDTEEMKIARARHLWILENSPAQEVAESNKRPTTKPHAAKHHTYS